MIERVNEACYVSEKAGHIPCNINITLAARAALRSFNAFSLAANDRIGAKK